MKTRYRILILGTALLILLIWIGPFPLTSADSIEPEDIKFETNGTHFQYGDQLNVTLYAAKNTTYKLYIEEKIHNLKVWYQPIRTNSTGVGNTVWVLNDTLLPRWHYAYIKLKNVSYGVGFDFKIDIDEVELMNWFQDVSGDMKETDRIEGIWNDGRICFVLFLFAALGTAVIWKKIKPYKVRVKDPVYDPKLGMSIRPFREFTLFERFLIGIQERLSGFYTRHKIRRKQVKRPYATQNLETDGNPPEKAKQKLDSNRKYLNELEEKNRRLLLLVNNANAKLKELRSQDYMMRDIRAINMKENELLKLRQERADIGDNIEETRKTIKIQEERLKELLKQEEKGVFLK